MSLCKVASLFHLRLHQLHVFLRVMLGVTFKGELLSFVHGSAFPTPQRQSLSSWSSFAVFHRAFNAAHTRTERPLTTASTRLRGFEVRSCLTVVIRPSFRG